MKKKILIVLAILFFLFLIIVVFRINPTENYQNKDRVSSATPTQTEVFFLKTESILPAQGEDSQYLPIQFVTITFNFPVTPDKFSYKADPLVETEVKNGDSPNIIILSPKEKWQEGITTITILQNTMSTNGVYLEKPIIYKIKTAFPKGGV